MKVPTKAKRELERDLFAELSEGMTALAVRGQLWGQPAKNNRQKSSIHEAFLAECE